MAVVTDTPGLGERIRGARIARNLSQVELAQRVGVSQATIAHWETGAHAPRPAMVDRLATALETDAETLVADAPRAPPAGAFDAFDYLKTPIRHVPVLRWPRTPEACAAILAGAGAESGYVTLSIAHDQVMWLTIEDPGAADEFPSGAMALVDRSDRLLRDGLVYLFHLDGRFLVRQWRTPPHRLEAPGDADTLFVATPPLPIGRILFSVRAY